MPALLASQVAAYAAAAGFKGNNLTIAVALAFAESGGVPTQSHRNADGSIDRGLWQINSVHSQYNAVSLMTPAYNAMAAYQVSASGTDFTPWVTYTNGAYKNFLGMAAGATNGGTSSGVIANLAWAKLPITHGYIVNYVPGQWDTPHFADDIGMPFHTPIGSLVSGMVAKADFQPWGGQVFIMPDGGGPGGAQFYVYHLDTLNVRKGQRVAVGDLLGLSGGQNSGGFHPVSTAYSSGPHTHAGWFLDYRNVGAMGMQPYGPDITPLLTAVKGGDYGAGGTVALAYMTTGASSGASFSKDYTPLLDQVHQTLINTPGFHGIALAIDEMERFSGWIDLTTPQPDISIVGQDTGLPAPDVNGFIRSVIATANNNFPPFAMRFSLVLIGFILFVALLLRAIGKPLTELAPIIAGGA